MRNAIVELLITHAAELFGVPPDAVRSGDLTDAALTARWALIVALLTHAGWSVMQVARALQINRRSVLFARDHLTERLATSPDHAPLVAALLARVVDLRTRPADQIRQVTPTLTFWGVAVPPSA
jgi:hypothetical protein